MTQPFPDDSIERARRYSTEEKQELERQLGEMTSTEPTTHDPKFCVLCRSGGHARPVEVIKKGDTDGES